MTIDLIIILAGLIIAIFPLIMCVIASLIANILNININEGGTNHFIGKFNIGKLLSAWFMMPWIMFATVPIGMAVILIGGIICLI